jgi:hypothetical protein
MVRLAAVITATAALAWGAMVNVSVGEESRPSCLERDLPDWEASVDYRTALASETLAPDRVTRDGQTIKTNLTETSVETALGRDFSIVEDWSQRGTEQQCAYVAVGWQVADEQGMACPDLAGRSNLAPLTRSRRGAYHCRVRTL